VLSKKGTGNSLTIGITGDRLNWDIVGMEIAIYIE
jgi:hypothetical protein